MSESPSSERAQSTASESSTSAQSPTSSTAQGSLDDAFELYDLRVEVICPPGARILCGAKPGDHFTLHGEMLHLPPGQGFSIYSLAAVLPLLAAKQRAAHRNDWIESDAEVACPDPHCASRLRIARTARRVFSHAAVSAVPLGGAGRGGGDGGGEGGGGGVTTVWEGLD